MRGSESHYSFMCTIPDLSGMDQEASLLQQAPCHVDGNNVRFSLSRHEGESDEQLTLRAEEWVGTELSRINVLTGKLLKALSFTSDPGLGVIVKIPTAWDHLPQDPPSRRDLSEASRFRVSIWDTARHTQNPILLFVLLDSICESANVPQSWFDTGAPPPRFSEIRIIRNLLAHGDQAPNTQVRKYLDLLRTPLSTNRYNGRRAHIEWAKIRSNHLRRAVWRIVLNDCIDSSFDLMAELPASSGGIFMWEDGPCPSHQ